MENGKMTKKQGRPKAKIDSKKVRDLAAEGLTQSQIAASLRVARSTLTSRFSEDEKLKGAYETGSALALAKVERSLMAKAISGDVSAAKFVLSTRLRDTYSTRSELTGADGAELFAKNPSEMTLEEINREIELIESGKKYD